MIDWISASQPLHDRLDLGLGRLYGVLVGLFFEVGVRLPVVPDHPVLR